MTLKKFVLLVEDEEMQLKLFSKIIANEIRSYGYEVVTLSNGKDAIKFLSGGKSDLDISRDEVGLILVDLSMYDISGFQVIEEIKSLGLTMPVAVLTAHDDAKIAKEAKKLGAADYFIKGKDVKELDRLKNFIIKAF